MTTELLSLLIALRAVFVGPVVSYKIAKSTIYANLVLASERESVIKIRLLMAELVTNIGSLTSLKSLAQIYHKDNSNKEEDKNYALKPEFMVSEYFKSLKNFQFQITTLKLMLQPGLENHDEIQSKLDKASVEIQKMLKSHVDEALVENLATEIINACHKFLLTEKVRIESKL